MIVGVWGSSVPVVVVIAMLVTVVVGRAVAVEDEAVDDGEGEGELEHAASVTAVTPSTETCINRLAVRQRPIAESYVRMVAGRGLVSVRRRGLGGVQISSASDYEPGQTARPVIGDRGRLRPDGGTLVGARTVCVSCPDGRRVSGASWGGDWGRC